jgi:cytochrome c peroxidase
MDLARITASVLLAASLAACSGEPFSEDEIKLIAELRLSQLGPVPPDQSNRVADDPKAAALGEKLFFDTRLSRDGTVSCATCHVPEKQFQDGLARAEALDVGNRRTMPLAGVGHSKWFFWDGRADSLWAQALTPIEDPREHGFSREGVAKVISEHYAADFGAVFGEVDAELNMVFANVGKALAAFQRTIAHRETRFDRFAEALVAGRKPEGDAALDSLEIEGLKLFIGKANCIDCHNGPRFTDEFFHNTGVPAVVGLERDTGRLDGIAKVTDDPFNCLGAYSDAAPDACQELRFMLRDEAAALRAYKTPSLRGVALRAPYMHAGQFATLDEVIAHYSTAPDAPEGKTEIGGVIFTDRGRAALIAFLKTLD